MKLGGYSLALGAGAALALLITGASMQSTAGATPDVDSDGVLNLIDNCVEASNGNNAQGLQVDSDRDGFGNPCDGDMTGPTGGAGNGIVNAQDFTYFASSYGSSGPAGAGYESRADMNSNGFINAQDFTLFAQQYVLGVPGPSGLRCASTTAGADNLTQRMPCEVIHTFRVKCAGVVISDPATGDDLRYIQSKEIRARLGVDQGHCAP